jgi:hypothetical protein
LNSELSTLNLPPFDYKIKEIEGKNYIFDIIRRKYLILTPEEWVRQHFIHVLISQYSYPKSLFRIEGGLKYNQLQKRSDIIVYDKMGNPFLLVECKAADVTLNQAVVEQASRYNQTIRAKYLAITNGLKTFCFEVDFETTQIRQLKDLPFLEDLG